MEREYEHMSRFRTALSSALATLLVAVAAGSASADTITLSGTSAGGHDISARADITYGSGSMTITLTNLTSVTYSPAELLTGFAFDFVTAPSSASLSAAAAAAGRTVTTGGYFTDTSGSVNLMTANGGGATWALAGLSGGGYRLAFNPDAKYAIIGAADAYNASLGKEYYSQANGGIVNNSGHNPFSAESATFTISGTGLSSSSQLANIRFLFGTDLGTVLVPVPPAAALGAGLLGVLGLLHLARRRRPSF
jgi:hypothetical protein